MPIWKRNGAAVSNVDTAGFLEFTKQRELAKQKTSRISQLEDDVKTLNERLDKQDKLLMEILKHVQK